MDSKVAERVVKEEEEEAIEADAAEVASKVLSGRCKEEYMNPLLAFSPLFRPVGTFLCTTAYKLGRVLRCRRFLVAFRNSVGNTEKQSGNTHVDYMCSAHRKPLL